MFGGRFSSSIGYVGVDFGATAIKLLQVREQSRAGGGGLEVVGAARIDLTAENARTPEAVAAHIRAAFAQGGFTGRRCVVSLPRTDVSVQSIRLPRMEDAELRQSATWEAAQRFGFDRGAMEVDFIRTGATLQSGENREEILLIAAPHQALNAKLELLHAADLRPVAVDVDWAAAARAVSRHVRREADRSVVRALIDVGATGSTFLILRGDQIAFAKPITIGGKHFTQAVAEHLQMDVRSAAELRAARLMAAAMGGADSPAALMAAAAATGAPTDPNGLAGSGVGRALADPSADRAVFEAVRPLMGDLVKEVMLCVRYYGVTFRGHPPERLIITGGDGLEPRLDAAFQQTLKVPIAFDDSSATLATLAPQVQAILNRKPGPHGCWAVALGLSMRGLGGRRAARAAKASRGSVTNGASKPSTLASAPTARGSGFGGATAMAGGAA